MERAHELIASMNGAYMKFNYNLYIAAHNMLIAIVYIQFKLSNANCNLQIESVELP